MHSSNQFFFESDKVWL